VELIKDMAKALKQKYIRTKLNNGQIEVLELIYKYRFVSRQLLAGSLGVKPENGLYEKLEILVKNGYLGKWLDKSLKMQNVPAAYYLEPKAMKLLKELPKYEKIDNNTIKNSYNEKNVSAPFITLTLQIYAVSRELERLHPEIKFFTKRDLAHQNHFPKSLPDAFVSLKANGQDKPNRYFLDVIENSTPRYKIDKLVVEYVAFFEEGGWDATNSPLPKMLLLCESGSFERRLQRIVARKLSNLGSNDLEFFTSTLSALKSANPTTEIWSNAEEPDELVNLFV